MNIQNDLKIFQIASKVLTPLKIKRLKFSVVSWFSIILYGIKRRPGNAGNQQKAFEMRKKPLLTVIITRQQLKKNKFVISIPFLQFNSMQNCFQASMISSC